MGNSLGTAVVTGASAGIGEVYADRLAKRGYDLVLVARRSDKLNRYAESLRKRYGVAVRTLIADLSQTMDLERVATALRTDDSIALLVNNAGTATLAASVDINSSSREAMTEVNVTALVRLTLAVIPGFKARKKGILINIGSVLGFHSLPFSSIYSGTKGFVLNFTRGLHDELAGTGITVQLVLPASTATDLWEISGVPLAALNPAHVMTAGNCVDAALAGLDQGETMTLPSVEDNNLLVQYEAARLALFAASQSGKPATRYHVAG